MLQKFQDWGDASEKYDEIRYNLAGRDLTDSNEAATRFDVIDRFLREVLGWQHGQIAVEEQTDEREGYVDYLLRVADSTIVVEAKKSGAAFPSPTRRSQLKMGGAVLGNGDIGKAIVQAGEYAVDKDADVAVVTNGSCWCLWSTRSTSDTRYATILFPLEVPTQAEDLFQLIAEPNVRAGSLRKLTQRLPIMEDRLITAFKEADRRIDRNRIADYIQPALDTALYAEAILTDADQLEKCFVTTEARTKFDATLGIHLADPKPRLVEPARRVKTGQAHGPLQQLVTNASGGYAPPVTLIMGAVGAGKSTYLKHFELVAGSELLGRRKAHWIYVDFEAMGPAGEPRRYVYDRLLAYIEADHPHAPIEYGNVIKPAYDRDIKALAKGPLAPIRDNADDFNRRVSEHILADYQKIEPYVDKVLGHLAAQNLCVIVLDNSDLYEDEELETTVFAEGLALSRRLRCNVIVSLRADTYVRHRHDSAFDAYEFRKLWIDPPPLKSVISSRLSYAKKILHRKSARLTFPNAMTLNVPDLSVFFDIVQRSILGGDAGDYIDAVADGNIRQGLTLVRNFLTSGHIEANKALKTYVVEKDTTYTFPFHEIYKGTMLGQWRHFREERSESVNVFDSRLGSRRLRLLRQFVLTALMSKAQQENSVEVPVSTCIEIFSSLGASAEHLLTMLSALRDRRLVRSVTAEGLDESASVVITRAGAYYTKFLARTFVYAEECMFDTAIEDPATWQQLADLTSVIEGERYAGPRMELRRERIGRFLDYLVALEDEALTASPALAPFATMRTLRAGVIEDVDGAVRRAHRADANRADAATVRAKKR